MGDGRRSLEDVEFRRGILRPLYIDVCWLSTAVHYIYIYPHHCLMGSPRFLPSNFIAHRVQQSHCSSIFHRVLLAHALALSAGQFVYKKKSPRFYTNIHSGRFELTKLTYARLADNLILHSGDWLYPIPGIILLITFFYCMCAFRLPYSRRRPPPSAG